MFVDQVAGNADVLVMEMIQLKPYKGNLGSIIKKKTLKPTEDWDDYHTNDSKYCPTEPRIYTLETNFPLNEAFKKLNLPSDMKASNKAYNEYTNQ